ncbi:bifunctional hydroxymethylpyrimidine kinase/phosphomethylpyrimidine kinase [Paraglaciecola sp. L3A3]|uniref:bifunctional hydroxymethylpyrimidine kinase/phosphomethylpyrimidine kinase n=1 Tax=Paraglaciecola sp. L3A3 TaxID=2686358 RepID=UPI00131DD21A|nr:bifunctional hydroxymethylpyrimidine kinase/phosphomethylpyrimidine kinase [Paraglaciecola sp. L3A3]
MIGKDTRPSLGTAPNEGRPIVWSIAASDSGGGAGIQADNLTIQDLGGHACNIITATTAQNSIQITSLVASSIQMLAAQLDCLRVDMPPKAIKIGVMANAQQVQFISQWLADNLTLLEKSLGQSIPVIWDPVMITSTGHMLTESDTAPTVTDYLQLAKQVTLITPNFKEFTHLTQTEMLPEQEELWQNQLQLMVQQLATNVLLTGGDHAKQQATDWLFSHDIEHTSLDHQQQLIGFSHNKILSSNNHGTGCTFSSAIATTVALGHPLLDAICIAKAYVNQGLISGYAVGQGAGVLARIGWPNKLDDFPEIILPQYNRLYSKQDLSFKALKTPIKIYPVTQSLTVLEQVLRSGALTVQLRIKDTTDLIQLEQDIQQAIRLGRQYQAQVFINDHWQLAIKHGAFGVHLGQEDLLQADLQQISSAGLALGLSSHGYFEMLLVQQTEPSYLAIGHIFPTPTKSMPSQPQGLLKLSRYCRLLKEKLPLVAIGGIDANNLALVHATGVNDAAVVRAIEQADDPGMAWQSLQNQWQSYL